MSTYWDEALQYIKSKGAKLGTERSGYYAKVYVSEDRAFKVWTDDWAYYSYMKWARRHQDNPFVPRIYSVKKFGCVYVVEMEKLKHTKGTGHKYLKPHVDLGGATKTKINFKLFERTWDCGVVYKNHHLKKLMNYLRRKEWSGYFVDIHDRNWMIRGDGHLVCTDPLSP